MNERMVGSLTEQETIAARDKWKKNRFRMTKFPGGQPDVMTRQRRRAECRKIALRDWTLLRDQFFTVIHAPQDDSGVIPRPVRRSIALQVARDAFRRMGRPGTNVDRG